jgi:hypothetical protein
LARRPPTSARTWGYRRAEILGAAAQATLLLVVGIYVLVEGVQRLISPPDVASTAMVVFGLYTSSDRGVSARVVMTEVAGSCGREVQAAVRMDPADAAVNAEWFDVTAWQGGGLVVEPLRRVGPGRYRTTDPVPVHGNWKTMIRFERGNSLTALPIYLPRDAAIPVPEIPALPTFTRAFRDEHKLLQREQTGGAPVVVALAYAVVIAIALGLLALIAWALHRLAFGPAPGRRPAGPSPRPLPAREHAGVGS